MASSCYGSVDDEQTAWIVVLQGATIERCPPKAEVRGSNPFGCAILYMLYEKGGPKPACSVLAFGLSVQARTARTNGARTALGAHPTARV